MHGTHLMPFPSASELPAGPCILNSAYMSQHTLHIGHFIHSVLCNVHGGQLVQGALCTLRTDHCWLVHNAHYTKYPMHSAKCTINPQSTVHSASYLHSCTQCTSNTQCTVHSVHRPYTVQSAGWCTLYNAQCCTMYLHSAQCTIHNAKCRVYRLVQFAKLLHLSGQSANFSYPFSIKFNLAQI